MPLDGPLELAQLPVPDFDGVVLGAGGEGGEDGVEGDAGYGQAVRFEDVAGRRFREPVGRVLGAPREGGGGGVVDFGLEEGVAGFEVEDLVGCMLDM